MKDYYAILGVTEHASRDDIRDAYRKLAFEWHPDRNPERREAAHARFLDLGEAYTVLKDARQRTEYDLSRPKPRPKAKRSSTGSGPAWADPWEDPERSAGTTSSPPPVDDDPSSAAFPNAFATTTLREHRDRVKKLARELASADRQGRINDIVLASATLAALVMALILTAFRLIGLNLPEFQPTLWAVVIAWMTTLVLAAWFFSLRERRVEQYVPYAEEVLERTGHGWKGPDSANPAGV